MKKERHSLPLLHIICNLLSFAVAIDLIVLHIGELLRSGSAGVKYLDDVFMSLQSQQPKPRRVREH